MAAAGALLLAIGIAIGTRVGSSDGRAPAPATVAGSDEATPAPSDERAGAGDRTHAGAVVAATAYVGALDGSAILDAERLHRTLTAVASADALPGLIQAYEQAASLTRERLGVGTAPEPIVIVRAAPVGYRVDEFTRDTATVSIWRVGIVGSGATMEPRQAWRTETVTLVWERAEWKVASFRSTPGPTPPLGPSAVVPAADLFTSIPQFEEFHGALP